MAASSVTTYKFIKFHKAPKLNSTRSDSSFVSENALPTARSWCITFSPYLRTTSFIMDPDTTSQEPPKAQSFEMKTPGSRAFRNQAWIRHKDEIHEFYMLDDNTLPTTMELFEKKYGLKACTRTWKAKLKEWKFEKYLTDHQKTAIIVRAEKRKREEGKETIFFHFGRRIDAETLENFKKRSRGDAADLSSPICKTPENISYSTPTPERGVSMTEDTLEDASSMATQHPKETTTVPSDSEAFKKSHRDFQVDTHSPVAYAATLLEEIVPFDELKSKGKIAEEHAMRGYRASLVQRSIINSNLEFLETAYSDGRVRIKVNGLIAEGITTEPETLVWSVSRSPANSWCHGCLRIIGARIRFECSICPKRDGVLYYCLACYNNGKGSCLNQHHQLNPDESLLRWKWNCKQTIKPFVHKLCQSDGCGKCVEGIYFHCCTCRDDDFDICLQCVAKGHGCEDLEHVLELAVSTLNPLMALGKQPQRVSGLVDEIDEGFLYPT